MKSKDVQKKTGLTRKAIEYYEEQGLLHPLRDENGYRSYSEKDVSELTRINTYRKLGLNLFEIKNILSATDERQVIANIIRDKMIHQKINEMKFNLLSQVVDDRSLSEIEEDLISLEAQETVYERLLDKFPGYIGQTFFLHYAPFLQGRLETNEQKEAFDELVSFLDRMDNFPFTDEEKDIVQNAAADITVEKLESISVAKMKAVRDTPQWMKDNNDLILRYSELKNSDDYQSIPIVQLFEKIKQFLQESGYYETAIPLIRKMSPDYDRYYHQLIQSNEYFMKNFSHRSGQRK